MKNRIFERGSHHLVLVVVAVVALVGILGFVGYSAWQRQSFNAGGEDTVARAKTQKLILSANDWELSGSSRVVNDGKVKVVQFRANPPKKNKSAKSKDTIVKDFAYKHADKKVEICITARRLNAWGTYGGMNDNMFTHKKYGTYAIPKTYAKNLASSYKKYCYNDRVSSTESLNDLETWNVKDVYKLSLYCGGNASEYTKEGAICNVKQVSMKVVD